QAAFQKRTPINAGRSVALKVDKVTRLAFVSGVKEVVETDFEQRGQGGIGRDVPADALILLILAVDHRHRVPANEALDAALEGAIAGDGDLLFHRDRIEIRGVKLNRNVYAGLASAFGKRFQQLRAAVCAFLVNDLVKGFNPLCDLLGVRLYRYRKFLVHGL